MGAGGTLEFPYTGSWVQLRTILHFPQSLFPELNWRPPSYQDGALTNWAKEANQKSTI